MITESFDPKSPAILTPERCDAFCGEQREVCIFTFVESVYERAVRELGARVLCHVPSCRQKLPVLELDYRGRKIALFLTLSTASSCGNLLEQLREIIRLKKLVMFGSCGALDEALCAGRLIVPDRAYRDEGLSYHYCPPSDYIAVKNADRVEGFLRERGIPCVRGASWTTDGLYRETRSNMEKRRREGCLAVEMELAAVQAVCDFNGLELYDFLLCGDLLDAPEWERRILDGEAEYDVQWQCFRLALELAASL